jgi:hypothetical protein
MTTRTAGEQEAIPASPFPTGRKESSHRFPVIKVNGVILIGAKLDGPKLQRPVGEDL